MNTRFSATIGLLSLCLISVSNASNPVNIILKDGQTIAARELRREGKTVIATVQLSASTQVGSITASTPSEAKIGYPTSNIASIAFPEPPEITATLERLKAGNSTEALALIEPVFSYHESFRDIPGNWWTRTALAKFSVLLALGKDAEAEALLTQFIESKEDPETILQARLQLAAAWGRKGNNPAALDVFNAVIKQSERPETRAQAWLQKGRFLLTRKEYEPALLAFLHVPVYFSSQNNLLPAALLGSAQAYAGIQDTASAQDALNSLIRDHPSSPEAALAKSELDKLTPH
jgi:hypothetical protein